MHRPGGDNDNPGAKATTPFGQDDGRPWGEGATSASTPCGVMRCTRQLVITCTPSASATGS